jgi:Uma2 family endonuclease
MASVVLADQFAIPFTAQSLTGFRRWTRSDEFPQRGRIDFINGSIEVDMSPEELFRHGRLKTALIVAIGKLVEAGQEGLLLTDSSRVTAPQAELSAEPDLVFVSQESLANGAVRLVPSASAEDEYIELEGGPDLVVEVVSNSSVAKDTRRLPPAYYQAGVREYWLADARKEILKFQVFRRGEVSFEPVDVTDDNYQYSAVLDRHIQLVRTRDSQGHWHFVLQVKA